MVCCRRRPLGTCQHRRPMGHMSAPPPAGAHVSPAGRWAHLSPAVRWAHVIPAARWGTCQPRRPLGHMSAPPPARHISAPPSAGHMSPPSETYRSPGISICFTVCRGSWGMKGECGFRFLASKTKKGGYNNTIFLCVNPKTKRHNSSKKILFFIDSVWIASSYIGICLRGGGYI
jgi:hypothetical protein